MTFKIGQKSWCKGLKGKEYLSHFKDGKTWNKDMKIDELKKHYPNGIYDLNARENCQTWNKDVKGKDYLKHYKNGKVWNKDLPTDELNKHYPNGRGGLFTKGHKRGWADGTHHWSKESRKKISEKKIKDWELERYANADFSSWRTPEKMKAQGELISKYWKERESYKSHGRKVKDWYQEHPEFREILRRTCIERNRKAWGKFHGKRDMTGIEKIMFNKLLDLGYKFNVDFFYNLDVVTNPTVRFPDFLFPNKMLIIECDGDYWHKNTKQQDTDRDSELKELGYKVLHFTGTEINKNTYTERLLSELPNLKPLEKFAE